MFPTLRQMECAFQDQYFTACMYEDYERENINVDNCHEDILTVDNGHHHHHHLQQPQQQPDKSLYKNVINKKIGNSVINEDITIVDEDEDDEECSTTVSDSGQCGAGILATSTNVKSKAGQTNNGRNKQQKFKNVAKSCYKHIPHRDKPPHLVERRNARERRRVQAVNSAFARLRKSVPLENRNKRVSKVKTLQKAIEYINYLQDILQSDTDMRLASTNNRINKENGGGGGASRWICI